MPPTNTPFKPHQAWTDFPAILSLVSPPTTIIAAKLVSRVGPELVTLAADRSDLTIHDNGCSPGLTVTKELLALPDLQLTKNTTIHCTDISAGHVAVTEKLSADVASTKPNVTIKGSVQDAGALSLSEASVDASFTNFVVHGMPDGYQGVREIYRCLKPGGLAVVTVWRRNFNWEPMQAAHLKTREGAQRIVPTADKWMEEETLKGAMMKAGFEEGKLEYFLEEGVYEIEGREGCRRFAEAWWSMMGLSVKWREGDEEKWEEAVGIIEDGLKNNGDGDVVWDEAKGVWRMRMVATVAIGRK